jgi:hypothetical protein
MSHGKKPDTLLPVPSSGSGETSSPPYQRFLSRFSFFQWLFEHPKFSRGGGLIVAFGISWEAIGKELDGGVKTAAFLFFVAWTFLALTVYSSNLWDHHRRLAVSGAIIVAIVLSFLWWAYLPTPQRTELAAEGNVEPQPLRAYLIHASDPPPPNACDNLPPNLPIDVKSMKVVLLGPIATAYAPTQRNFSLIQIASEDVLTIETAPSGIVLNATLRDEKNQLIAKITKNVFVSYPSKNYEVRADSHSVLILDSENKIVLYVRYMNPRTIKVLGVFRVPNRRPVVIEENVATGIQMTAGMCSINDAPEGSWMQKKAVIALP